jgi:hypothetical protein
MRGVLAALIICFVASSPPEVALAEITKSVYAKKWAECKEQAKLHHFGIHWVKRNRWIRNCLTDARAKLR